MEEVYDHVLNKTSNKTSSNDTSPIDGENKTEPVKTEKRVRTHPYPLRRIEDKFHGLQSLTKGQITLAKDRLRWYENRDELKSRTDKAKNDFESVIYSMRAWLTDHGDAHQ